jgi:hypothetical protein
LFDTLVSDKVLDLLKHNGSYAVPQYMNPEGIVIFHKPSGYLFKKTIEKDEEYKWRNSEK